MNRFVLLFLFLSIFAISFLSFPKDSLSATPSHAVSSEQDIIYKMDSLFHYLAKQRGFNGNVLIAQNGKIIYENALGYSDFSSKTPLNIQSSFQLASITKQFTAMAIMMLHDEGKLNFTDTIQRFIPEFPYNDITIHQLLTHRSGLPEYMNFARRYWKNKNRLMTNEDILDILITHRPGLNFVADRKYKYSNTGYVVLACIIERVSGLQYYKFLEKKIFQPLHMDHSYVFTTGKMHDGKYSTLGYKKNLRRAREDYLSGVVGDKGIYSTVEDLLKWDQALYTEQLVKQSTLQEAFKSFSYDWKNGNTYGYGWRIETYDDGSKIVYHAGLWRGYSSLLVRRLQDKTAIIVLCNKVNWSFENIDKYFGILDSLKKD